jgi:exo-1,4-beta-D-glucosaminidase
VKLKNYNRSISLLNHIEIVNKTTNEEILPAFWDDNFVTLFPGEEKDISVRLAKKDIDKKSNISIVVDNNR